MYVTRQFFGANGHKGHFFENTKKRFQICPWEVCTEFQVYIVFHLVGGEAQTHRHIYNFIKYLEQSIEIKTSVY